MKEAENMSHPLRVRGLKQGKKDLLEFVEGVASFTGAWIETYIALRDNINERSHPLRVRGLKHTVTKWKVREASVASFTDATRSFFRVFKSSSFQST